MLLAKYNLQTYKETFKNLETQKQKEEDNKLELETAISQTEALLEKERQAKVKLSDRFYKFANLIDFI